MIREKIKAICNKKNEFLVETEMHDWYTYITYTCETDKHTIKLKFNKEEEICFNLEVWDTDEFKQIFLSRQEGEYLYEKFSKSILKVLKDDKKRQEELLDKLKI